MVAVYICCVSTARWQQRKNIAEHRCVPYLRSPRLGLGGFYVGEPDRMHFYKETYGGTGDVLERPYVVTGFEYIPGGAMEAAQPKE